MDSVQRLLVVVVISLTVLLIIVGIQVVFIILDLRKSVKRLNSILEDAILGGGLIRPDRLTGIAEMFKKDKSMTTHGNSND
ncbi:MAG: hypothetical protein ACD_19C00429G0074 [uncultured bacterium]|nr:MAG: hypothetical protein ACD_19C00429G0074 [uncultured bacterium]HCB31387.1 hypothetical protein [Acinetobacter lwoffii]